MNHLKLRIYAGNIVVESLGEKRLMDFLLENDFVYKEKSGKLKCTGLGRLAVIYYIKPETLKVIYEGLLNNEEFTEIAVKALTQEYRLTKYDSWVLAKIVKDWIDETTLLSITRKYSIEPGDFQSLIESLKWIFTALSAVARRLGLKETEKELKELENRIKYGVREELLWLCKLRIPGVGRVRGRKLFESGYKSLNDLKKSSYDDLVMIEGLGEITANMIVEYFNK